ncbi:MAG: T9SS type A sorting domain-containing protein, partial [Bacteroidales bacterium]|nr:T9SS type A sorting domain-containing protein [Bacteroidales bacterium]
DGNTDNPRTITVVEDTIFTAEFAIDRFTVTVESADTEMGTVSESGTYDYGTEIQISASARDGYQFASWNDDNTDNPRYITVTSDATYIASFIPAVGIDESIATEIAIFPNPANDILNITSSETISEIEIVNVMGQVVERIEVNSDNVVCNVEDLKAGVYVVRIRTASATLSQRRFVKE